MPAVRGGPGQIEISLGLQLGSLGLAKLVVDFGSIDGGKKLALLHAAADIHVPALEISIGTGVNGRLHVGLHVAWNGQLPVGTGGRRVRDRDGDFLGLRRGGDQLGAYAIALLQSPVAQAGKES